MCCIVSHCSLSSLGSSFQLWPTCLCVGVLQQTQQQIKQVRELIGLAEPSQACVYGDATVKAQNCHFTL